MYPGFIFWLEGMKTLNGHNVAQRLCMHCIPKLYKHGTLLQSVIALMILHASLQTLRGPPRSAATPRERWSASESRRRSPASRGEATRPPSWSGSKTAGRSAPSTGRCRAGQRPNTASGQTCQTWGPSTAARPPLRCSRSRPPPPSALWSTVSTPVLNSTPIA